MDHAEALIEGLEQIKRGELNASEYYAVARDSAEHHNRSDMASAYRTIGGMHAQLSLQVEGRKETLQKEAGEGILGEMLENMMEAFRFFVADLPAFFFEKETEPTPDMLIDLERDLLEKYRKLVDAADPKTMEILRKAIDAGESNIRTLEEFRG
jgi:hypothetical protein